MFYLQLIMDFSYKFHIVDLIIYLAKCLEKNQNTLTSQFTHLFPQNFNQKRKYQQL